LQDPPHHCPPYQISISLKKKFLAKYSATAKFKMGSFYGFLADAACDV
jgi:hypothetical protein